MFGGSGLFLDGVMFALIADGVLFFKSDEETRDAFAAEGCGPFTYARKGGQATLTSYWKAPEHLLDEPDDMLAWARDAHGVARRAAARKPRSKSAVKRGR
ncbi:MAG: TfoX/Sxy family protein [Hyphomicrobiaceae bacterium]